MRSLLVAASFPPALGGVETLLYQTTRRLADPPLVLAPVPAAAPDLTVQPVQLQLSHRAAYRPLWRLHPALHYLHAFWRPAVRAIATWRPGVLQAGHVYLAPLTWLLARRLGVPFVVYAYGQEVWRGGRPMGLGALDARLRGSALRAADRVLVPGAFTAGLLADEWHVKRERLRAIPYGAEPQPRHDLSPLSSQAATLLTVARLIPRKGVDAVITALAKLPEDVTYRVVGRGPDEPRLRALAESKGVADRVQFLGRLDDDALAAEYRRCTLFVLPARRTNEGSLEGYGLVYFEAAAWGRAVIAGRSGGEIDAVVDGETGLLIDGASPDEVEHAIAALLNDPARLQRFGEAGRRRVETTHNWSNAAATVDQTLRDLA
ncbi:MAG TPA: glycosyltransferase family 4 protein [Chloroflexota bacterium]|nr:glycosyltransferase family 4 protein [Chloroflexota bacterium]